MRLRKEQDQIQQRLSKMYDDRYDGKIDEVFFERKLQEYKARKREVVQEMERHVNKEKEKFIELRAGGMSFAKISQEIGVSKPTLIKWNAEFGTEVGNRRFLEIEELLDQYKLMRITRIKILGGNLREAFRRSSES